MAVNLGKGPGRHLSDRRTHPHFVSWHARLGGGRRPDRQRRARVSSSQSSVSGSFIRSFPEDGALAAPPAATGRVAGSERLDGVTGDGHRFAGIHADADQSNGLCADRHEVGLSGPAGFHRQCPGRGGGAARLDLPRRLLCDHDLVRSESVGEPVDVFPLDAAVCHLSRRNLVLAPSRVKPLSFTR